MFVSATEFKMKIGEYLDHSQREEVLITRYGKVVATLHAVTPDSDPGWNALLGVAAAADDFTEDFRAERLSRQ